MHELALAESMVSEICERVGSARVTRVILEIGALSCVEPQALRFSFDVCANGTCVEGASLECCEIPALARCAGCQAEVQVEGPIPVCSCGSLDLEVLQGDRLVLKAVEIV